MEVLTLAKDDVKYSKQELKEDEFVSMATVVLEWISKHRKQIFTGIAVIIVLVSIFELYRWYVDRRNAAASTALFEAMKAGASDDEKSDVKMTPEKRAEAIKAYEKVVTEYGSIEVGRMAVLQLASLKLDAGDAEGSLKAAEQFLKDTTDDNKFKPLALSLKGYALLKKNDAKGAADIFRRLADAKTPVGKDYALFDLGGALEKAGDRKGAAEALRRIGTELPRSPLKEKATAKADELDPQAKAAPEPVKK